MVIVESSPKDRVIIFQMGFTSRLPRGETAQVQKHLRFNISSRKAGRCW